MQKSDITIPVAMLALLRGEVSVRCLADRFGVTEAQVNEWKDVFVVAGVLAIHSMGKRPGRPQTAEGSHDCNGGLGSPTTTPFPTTRGPLTTFPPCSTLPAETATQADQLPNSVSPKTSSVTQAEVNKRPAKRDRKTGKKH